MNFETAVAIVFEHEGGYVNDLRDAGGETNFGISKRAYPDLNIKELTKADARLIYKRDYWDKIHADSLPEKLRLIAFDCAVNQGVSFCNKCLSKLNTKDSKDALTNFVDQRLVRYASLTTFPMFGLGWTRRLIDVLLKSIG